ncbi:hypothetical protein [Colwellia psychrerythraea]|uniref:Uncharacterized protein n=1 Tax=Colwellia psychrerythraea TaxID=28229 RepID=A0A099K7W0_COLPS|nr:hypothetical protein [Colwellia psychrerythraea]KGJ86385.1 hypothetical protein ND2E_0951 [Colwellia psychrerythraea]
MKIVLKFIGFIWAVSFLSFFVLSFYSGTGGEIPTIAQEYVIHFQGLLESFLTSQWFFIVFVAGWFGVSYSLGKQSGWQNLAKKYGNYKYDNPNVNFRTGNGYIGKIRHNGILKVATNSKGVYLRVLFPFKFGHKNLFIPWQDISVVTSERGLFSDKTPSFLKRIGKTISGTEYLNIKLPQFPEQRITIQSSEQLLGSIPKNINK